MDVSNIHHIGQVSNLLNIPRFQNWFIDLRWPYLQLRLSTTSLAIGLLACFAQLSEKRYAGETLLWFNIAQIRDACFSASSYYTREF